jgi:transcriptional regulator with XRE-family HTH domain
MQSPPLEQISTILTEYHQSGQIVNHYFSQIEILHHSRTGGQMSTPGARVRDLRKGRKWTQSELAEELSRNGVKSGTSGISMLESGEIAMSLAQATALADIFAVSVDYIACRTTDPVPCWPGNGRLVVEVDEEKRGVLEEWAHFLLPLPLDMLRMMLASLQGLRRELDAQAARQR